MQVKSCLIKSLGLAGCLSFLALWLGVLQVAAQTSTVTDVVSTSFNSTFFNGSGLSITNNGSRLIYDGPLNSVSDQSVNPTLQVTINGENLINGVPAGVAESLPGGILRVNTLSPQLEKAKLEIPSAKESVSLGIGGTVASYTEAGGSIFNRRSEIGKEQTLSIFPNLQPSVFTGDLFNAIGQGAVRTRSDALRTGAIKTDVIFTPASPEQILQDVPRTGVIPGDSRTGVLPVLP